MTQIKVSEASGAVLDWMVAKCEGWDTAGVNYPYLAVKHGQSATRWTKLRYSTDWSQGGPIIERETIATDYDHDVWNASKHGLNWYISGPTPLIAAMRCYCASKLGDVVEVPDELLGA